MPAFYRLLLARDPAAQARLAEAYRTRLAVLEMRPAASDGPFLSGDRPSLADVTVFTHLWRLAIVWPERGLSGAVGPGTRSLMQAMRRLPGIDGALASAEEATADLAPYLSGEVRGEARRNMTGQPGTAA